MVFRPIDLYVITSTFFYIFFRFFFSKSKKRDFLPFFAVFHTFSRTMLENYTLESRGGHVPQCPKAGDANENWGLQHFATLCM